MDQDRSALRELRGAASTPALRLGRDGFLGLRFTCRGTATVLAERRFRTPLQVLEALSFPGDPALGVMLLNPTGGVLGGDRLVTEMAVGDGAHVVVSTPSATRIYGSRGETAVQDTTATVGCGATLEYVPDHVIPHPRASFSQTLHADLSAGANLMAWDAWALGRVARGESWEFESLDSRIDIRRCGRPVFIDRFALRPASRRLGALPGSDGHAYVASWLAVGDEGARWEETAAEWGDLAACIPGVRAAGSSLAEGGALVRVLATSAYALIEAQQRLWAAARATLLRLAPLDLRKA